jgi:GT2 family glycosyltransferase
VRPSVDVVVPFVGSDEEFAALERRLSALELGDGDTCVIADNRPGGSAGGQPSSYFARNRGAERGSADWILFIDADVQPPPDLIDRYFDAEPGERSAVLAGAVQDEPLGGNPTRAERYAVKATQMAQSNTLGAGEWAYAQTANAAFRRSAFEEAGGFTEGIRSGGDADLCFRLRAAGWGLEERPAAVVTHDNRATSRAFLRQKARHGSGAAWLDRRYPGAFPPRNRRYYLRRLLREIKMSVPMVVKGRRDDAAELLFPTLVIWAFELGRFMPNTVKSARR